MLNVNSWVRPTRAGDESKKDRKCVDQRMDKVFKTPEPLFQTAKCPKLDVNGWKRAKCGISTLCPRGSARVPRILLLNMVAEINLKECHSH